MRHVPEADCAEALYHGTRVPFGPGGLVLPGNEVGIDNHGLHRSHVVYVTPDLDLAVMYADAAAGDGPPRVFRVVPMSPLAVDDSTIEEGEEQEAFACEWARVLYEVVEPWVDRGPC